MYDGMSRMGDKKIVEKEVHGRLRLNSLLDNERPKKRNFIKTLNERKGMESLRNLIPPCFEKITSKEIRDEKILRLKILWIFRVVIEKRFPSNRWRLLIDENLEQTGFFERLKKNVLQFLLMAAI